MRHALEYQGRFALNIDRVRAGARKYLHDDGTERDFRGPKDVDGIRFGVLEKPDKEFVIARIQATGHDIPLDNPISSDGTGPNGTLLSRAGAMALLEGAQEHNPTHAKVLSELRELVISSSDE